MGRHPVGVKGRNLTCFARKFSFIFVHGSLAHYADSCCSGTVAVASVQRIAQYNKGGRSNSGHTFGCRNSELGF